MEIIIRSRFRSIIGSNETAKRERRRRIKCAPETVLECCWWNTLTTGHHVHTYVFIVSTCACGLSSLLLSEAELERKSLLPLPLLLLPLLHFFSLLLPNSFFKSLFRESTHHPHPTWLEPWLPRHASNPISRPEYKSRCFLFASFPKTF